MLIKSNRTALQTYKVEERTFGTPYIQLVFKEKKVRTILNLCKRTAKSIDKLEPCKYLILTNRELKKQIFSNLEHTSQIARATEILLCLKKIPSDYHFRCLITYRTHF